MADWIANNQEWIFSGIGATIVGGIFAVLRASREKRNPEPAASSSTSSNVSTINIVNNVGAPQPNPAQGEAGQVNEEERIRRIKDSTRILFVDDDDKFKVVKILRNAGWTNTTIVKDVASLHENSVVSASIFFVDIQGVGLKLGFKDEGLGLAAALKDKYPDKKLVIYSAEPRGERFHKALRKADAALEKNADPYEFQQLVDEFAGLS